MKRFTTSSKDCSITSCQKPSNELSADPKLTRMFKMQSILDSRSHDERSFFLHGTLKLHERWRLLWTSYVRRMIFINQQSPVVPLPSHHLLKRRHQRRNRPCVRGSRERHSKARSWRRTTWCLPQKTHFNGRASDTAPLDVVFR